jgi:hypothetical protein
MTLRFLAFILCCICIALPAMSADIDEFKVKPEQVFEFTQKPLVKRHGDRVTITFASKAYCDATVAIEDGQHRIVRHLASGVLGAKAPEPFQANSLSQTLVWDGKNDQGDYVDDKDSIQVRVSLGLMPRFERTLYWSGYKRISQQATLIQANAQGVFLFEGNGVDSLKMFDHDGNYVRTVYPFPADKWKDVKGLETHDFPQAGVLPLKQSLYQQTLLTSGTNANIEDQLGRSGFGATGMAIRGDRIALVDLKLNRLCTDGTSGGQPLHGGKTSATLTGFHIAYTHDNSVETGPTSAAISPDGKWLYLAGYSYRHPQNFDTINGIMRMPLDGGVEDAKPFLGKFECKEGHAAGSGSKPGEFANATSVDCDQQGRVYVADFMNDRIQVFSPDGAFIKEIKCFKPAVVRIHKITGEIFVFSWIVPSRQWAAADPAIEVTPTLTKLGAFDDPKQLAHFDIPLGNVKVKSNGKYGTYTGQPHGLWFNAEIDPWAPQLTIWISRECRNDMEAGIHPGDGGAATPWETCGTRLLREKDGKLELVKDFGALTLQAVARAKPPSNAIQRLQVNPVSGKLYLGEADSGPTIKASNTLVEIDPETGASKIVKLPFNPMEYSFDLNGLIYLRNTNMIARYLPSTWREVPWDYGEETKKLGNDGGIFGNTADVQSAMPMPAKWPVCYHQGGINIAPNGDIIASCAYRFVGLDGKHFELDKNDVAAQAANKGYEPVLFPGRISNSTAPCLHIWNKHGQMISEDAFPGVGQVDGVAIDRDDNIYIMHTPTRWLDGKKYFNEMTETLMKVKPRKARLLSSSPSCPVPLTSENRPKRSPDMSNGPLGECWVEGAEWFYGGVGYAGFNSSHAGGGCACWFPRFTLDSFARSFAPEVNSYSIAVLDSNGNLILRIGRYGNIDDGKPLIPAGGPADAHSIGGDEVALFHACYVAAHTDRRLFISDVGNSRLLSVKLNYHASETVALREVKDESRSR